MDKKIDKTIRKEWSKRKKDIIAILILTLVFLIIVSVLNIMTISFTPPSTTSSAGSLQEVNATSETTGEIVFGAFTWGVNYDDIVICVYLNNTASGYLLFPPNGTGKMDWIGGPVNSIANYYDYNSKGLQINSGDYIEFEGLMPSSQYYFEFYNPLTASLISIVGDNPAILTPPEPPSLPSGGTGTFPDLPDYYPRPVGDKFTINKELIHNTCIIGIIIDLFLIIVVARKME